MRARAKKLMLVILLVGAVTQVALADLFSPFSFSFANSFLNSVFLFPFRLSGCS